MTFSWLQGKWFYTGVTVMFFICRGLCVQNPVISSSLFPLELREDGILELKANDTLHMTCKGEFPVFWDIQRSLSRYNEKDRNFLRKLPEAYITPSNSSYYRNLTVTGVQYFDTGTYSCRYKPPIVNSKDAEYLTSIYVFVFDDLHLFLDHQIVPGTFRTYIAELNGLEIPCQATSPSLKVSLWEEKSQREINAYKHNITYYPERGLVIKNPSGLSGDFLCRGELGNLTEEFHFWIISLDVVEPYLFIEIRSKQAIQDHQVMQLSNNVTLQLVCKSTAPIEWDIKRAISEISPLKKTTSSPATVVPWSDKKYKYLNLTVPDVQYSDTGTYICKSSIWRYSSDDISNSSVYVYVNDDLHLFLDHQIVPGTFRTYIAERKTLEIPCQATSPSLKVSLWEEKSQREISVYKHKITYEPERGLVIKNPSGLSGDFLCRGELGNLTEEFHFWIIPVVVEPSYFIEIRSKQAIQDHQVMQLSNNVTLQLICKSTVPIEWDIKRVISELFVLKKPTSNPATVVPWSDKKYKYLNLTVPDVQYSDTGTYICKFSNWRYSSNDTSKSSVYVYVNDGSHLFVNLDDHRNLTLIFSPYQNHTLIVPCRTTSPDLNVTFWQELPQKDITQSIENIVYDPKIGFIIPNVKELNGKCSCRIHDESGLRDRFDFRIWRIDETPILSVSTIGGMADCNIGIVQISSEVYQLKAYNGSKVKLCVKIKSYLHKNYWTVTWNYNQNKIISTENRSVAVTDEGTILTIHEVHEEDFGSYILVVNTGRSFDGSSKLKIIVHAQDGDLFLETSVNNQAFIILGVVIPIVLVGIVGFITFYLRKKRKLAPLDEKSLIKQCQETNIPFDLRWEFPKQRIAFGPKIGQGAFGKVVRAKATGIVEGEDVTTVAVKMLKVEACAAHKRALLEELKILILLGKHLNIVNLLGAVTKFIYKGELLVIMEHCSQGSLRELIIRKQKRFVSQLTEDGLFDRGIKEEKDFSNPSTSAPISNGNTKSSAISEDKEEEQVEDSSPLTTSDLLNYSFQSSRGMEYLASRKLVHRDLAARNVLVNNENIVKICDFGLTKDEDYLCRQKGRQTNILFPIRWMSPEAIGHKAFSSKSDVWSFGVLLWEIFSLGLVPYPGVDMNDNFYQRLLDGYRMDKPKFAPDTIYEIMMKCWSLLPEDRPDFGQLTEFLGSLIEDAMKEYYLILNKAYEEENQKNPNYEKLEEIFSLSLDNGDENRNSSGITKHNFLIEE